MLNGSNGERKHGGMGLPGEPLRVVPTAETGRVDTQSAPTMVGVDRTQVEVRIQTSQVDLDSLRPLVASMNPRVVRRIKRAEGVRYMGQ